MPFLHGLYSREWIVARQYGSQAPDRHYIIFTELNTPFLTHNCNSGNWSKHCAFPALMLCERATSVFSLSSPIFIYFLPERALIKISEIDNWGKKEVVRTLI